MEHKKISLIVICLIISIGILTWCSTNGTQNLTPIANDIQVLWSGHRFGSGSTLESGHREWARGQWFGASNRPMIQQKNPPVQIQQSDSSWGSDTLGQTTTVNKTVAISNACIGCGKCARVASNTFAMSNHKATVISQNYASSDAVQHAASNCPVGAISIS